VKAKTVGGQLGVILARSYRACARAAARKVAEFDLTQPQFRLLSVVYDRGRVPLGHVAEHLGVTPGSVTYVANRLVERGLLRRCSPRGDRRRVEAELTRAGRALMEELIPSYAAFVVRLLSSLSPEEQRVATRLLDRLGEGIGRAVPDAGVKVAR